MSDIGSNRLAMLAAEIRASQAGVEGAAVVRANHALDAGRALIEAKALLKHGRWLPWLKEHCALPERTAQLYMRLATMDLPAELIAVLGMQKAAESKTPQELFGPDFPSRFAAPDPLADYPEPIQREWLLFAWFSSYGHAEWCMRQGWESPDHWLADTDYRQRIRMPEPSQAFLDGWADHKRKHAATPRAEIEAALSAALAPAA